MLTKSRLQEFANLPPQPPRVSITSPIHRAGPGVREDAIRVNNLVDRATERLHARDPHDKANKSISDRLRSLKDDPSQWQQQGSGIAVLAADDAYTIIALDHEPDENAHVGERFLLRPILPAAVAPARFLLLTISQNALTLYECDREEMHEHAMHNVPRSMDEAIGAEREEKSLQHHAAANPSASGPASAYHGQRRDSTEPVGEINTFVARVAHAIDHVTTDDRRPLVLAGDDQLVSRFRDVSSHRTICDEHISGGISHADPQKLHTQALSIAEQVFDADRVEAIGNLERAIPSGEAFTDLASILTAAADGRVRTLLIRAGAPRFGIHDPERGIVQQTDTNDPNTDDLADLLIHRALRADAEIHVLRDDEMPDIATAAATLRY